MAYFFPVILFITLFFSLNSVHSAVIDSPAHRVFAQDSNGNWKTLRSAAGNLSIQSGNLGNSVTQVSRLPIPASNGKTYSVDVSRTANVDLLKVGSALGSLARKLSPVGMAIGTAAYICSETNICDIDGIWTKSGDPQYDGYPPVTDGISYYPNGWQHVTGYQPTQSLACSALQSSGVYGSTTITYDSGANKCIGTGVAVNVLFVGTCAAGYTLINGQCHLDESNQSRIATEQDWQSAESALNQPASTDHVINNGGDVPVDVSTPPTIDNAPISQPIGTTTSTTYDANNNATGTQTKETTLTVTDGATSNAPNQITYNETTIINNYDLNNNLIDSTVTETSAPPPEPPEIGDIEIEFDSVSENELEEYETPDMDDWTSWGSGSCPPPISINTNNWNGVLDTQPMCDFAEGINPFVLLFAALISAYIVAGIRTSGH